MGFSRQEYWSGLPFSSTGDLPDPRIKHAPPVLAGRFFTTEPPGKSHNSHKGFNTPLSLMSKSSRQKSTKKCWNQTIYQMNLDTHIGHSNQQQQNTHSFQIHVEHSTRQII